MTAHKRRISAETYHNIKFIYWNIFLKGDREMHLGLS